MTENVQWVKFYFDKWRNDPGLRLCSLAARGLWMDLLGVMHNSTPYGHLVVNMVPCSTRDVMQFVGTSTFKEVKKLMSELKDAGVFSETSEGVVYCRRMVRDNAMREKSRVYGKTGGNPALNGVNPPKQGSRDGDGPLPLKIEIEIEKEREKKEKENTLRVSKKPGVTPIDPKWQPSPAGVAYAKERGVPQTEVQNFVDHHTARGNVMANWDAAWRMWCRNAVKFGNATTPLLDRVPAGVSSGFG